MVQPRVLIADDGFIRHCRCVRPFGAGGISTECQTIDGGHAAAAMAEEIGPVDRAKMTAAGSRRRVRSMAGRLARAVRW